MRLALISPLIESVPPHGYGGTERVVHWLAEELVARGHEVTLFASGDSQTSADLVPMCERSLRAAGSTSDHNALHIAALAEALQRRPRFDLIHSHVDWPGIALAQWADVPVLSTLHGRLDLAEPLAVIAACPDAPLVSISDSQRAPVTRANWAATIHHGLPVEQVEFIARSEEYFAFVGRMSREKRPDLAIRAACLAKRKLKIAAKAAQSSEDADYYETEIKPLLEECGEWVEFVGEITEAQKPEFMGNAKALLFPIDWPEPFGLVAIEAMSFGTPVIARPFGALPEIVEDGRTGFLVDTVEEMVAAMRSVDSLSRAHARAAVRERFSVSRMVDEYEGVYRRLAARNDRASIPRHPMTGS
jgi:glycosyltransferase involved in cell wall biosynthesis